MLFSNYSVRNIRCLAKWLANYYWSANHGTLEWLPLVPGMARWAAFKKMLLLFNFYPNVSSLRYLWFRYGECEWKPQSPGMVCTRGNPKLEFYVTKKTCEREFGKKHCFPFFCSFISPYFPVTSFSKWFCIQIKN